MSGWFNVSRNAQQPTGGVLARYGCIVLNLTRMHNYRGYIERIVQGFSRLSLSLTLCISLDHTFNAVCSIGVVSFALVE